MLYPMDEGRRCYYLSSGNYFRILCVVTIQNIKLKEDTIYLLADNLLCIASVELF